MKYALVIFALVLVYNIVDANVEDGEDDEDNESIPHDAAFEIFKNKHNITYDKKEEIKRKLIYIKNRIFVHTHRKNFKDGKHSFNCRMNGFADLTSEEFSKMAGYVRNEPQNVTELPKFRRKRQTSLPASYDWTPKYVTPVQNQGKYCGSCYAFSALDAVESQILMKGYAYQLSDQQSIDCSTSYKNQGCSGGLPQYVYNYLISNQGINYESTYPYEAAQGSCRYPRGGISSFRVSKYYQVYPNENSLQYAVCTSGPIVVGIDGYRQALQFYSDGVYTDPTCRNTKDDLNHSVLVVGYGISTYNELYWKVKNTWGTNWGMNGYFYIARNKNNMCGIATDPVYPVVEPR